MGKNELSLFSLDQMTVLHMYIYLVDSEKL